LVENSASVVFPLFPGGAAPRRYLILLQDWRPTQQFVDQPAISDRRGVVFGFALVGGYFFSRRMSQPLRAIAAAAGDIAAGNLTRQLPVRGSAEASSTAVAFGDIGRAFAPRTNGSSRCDSRPLTELPNRILFMERLERAISRRTRHPDYLFAVLFVDLDRFKTVNDSLGHPAGDRLLTEIAGRLDDALRRDDMVSRPAATGQLDADTTLARGGDEFTILIEDIGNPSDAVRVAERIQETLAKPVQLDGQKSSPPQHRDCGQRARTARGETSCGTPTWRYARQGIGGDQCAICDATMHHRAVERLRLESDLRHAVERQEFTLCTISRSWRSATAWSDSKRWSAGNIPNGACSCRRRSCRSRRNQPDHQD
jgi:diguanylate cyclase (GGDEF)-like protein